MQAVALVTGDEFLTSYNVSIPTEDLIEYLASIVFQYDLKDMERYSHFDDRYRGELTPVLGPSGYCYNFNMAPSKQILNLDLYAH
jgi:hypothetical protein